MAALSGAKKGRMQILITTNEIRYSPYKMYYRRTFRRATRSSTSSTMTVFTARGLHLLRRDIKKLHQADFFLIINDLFALPEKLEEVGEAIPYPLLRKGITADKKIVCTLSNPE